MNDKSVAHSPLSTAAHLLGCRPEEILSVRATAGGGLSVVAPSGRKLAFSPEEVGRAVASLLPGEPSGRKRRAA